MRVMSSRALQVVAALFVWALAAMLAALTPPARASEDQKDTWDYSVESKTYKLTCTNKIPSACERIIELLKNYDQYQEDQHKEEQGKQKEENGESDTLTYNKI